MKTVKLFINSAGVFLLITATAKLISSFGYAPILQTSDPLTGLQFQNLFRIVASIEMTVVLVCFFSKNVLLSAGLVAWLSATFLAYRICLVLVGYHRPCSCMGNLTDALHIPPQTADTARYAAIFVTPRGVVVPRTAMETLAAHKMELVAHSRIEQTLTVDGFGDGS